MCELYKIKNLVTLVYQTLKVAYESDTKFKELSLPRQTINRCKLPRYYRLNRLAYA